MLRWLLPQSNRSEIPQLLVISKSFTNTKPAVAVAVAVTINASRELTGKWRIHLLGASCKLPLALDSLEVQERRGERGERREETRSIDFSCASSPFICHHYTSKNTNTDTFNKDILIIHIISYLPHKLIFITTPKWLKILTPQRPTSPLRNLKSPTPQVELNIRAKRIHHLTYDLFTTTMSTTWTLPVPSPWVVCQDSSPCAASTRRVISSRISLKPSPFSAEMPSIPAWRAQSPKVNTWFPSLI